MADYVEADDGKIHTRYSELIRCTPGQIDRVVWEHRNPGNQIETEHMGFGTLRHEMFEEEGRATGYLPKCFGRAKLDYIEHEFTSEIWKGIVIHSRPDAVSASTETVYDYKTVVDGKNGWKSTVDGYRHESKQRQLRFYAYQMGLHNIRIRHGAFLCEVWNQERDTILHYEVVTFDITMREMASVLNWAGGRASLLASVLDEVPA
jgi:hypothetical protein